MEKDYRYFIDEGIFKFQQGHYKEAIDFINKSVELKNDWEISYFFRGACYQALEQFDEAMLDYTKALKINPKMTDAYYNRAKIILDNPNSTQKEIKSAVSDLEKALAEDEKFIDALYAMAVAKKKLQDYHASLEYLEKLLNIEPDAIYAKALKKLILQKYII